MRPILPHKILLNTKQSYQTFRKNQIKISLNLEINQNINNTHVSRLSKLLKIFKTLKYTRNLDLSNLEVSQGLLSKTIYFAKQMSNIRALQLSDRHLPRHMTKGVFESWPKYAKRIKTLSYHALEHGTSRGCSLFSNHLLRYQPCIKDLSIRSLCDADDFLQNYCRHRKSPPILERLSLTLNNSNLRQRIIASRFPNPLKNLRHFEIKSDSYAAENAIAFIMKPLPLLCIDLQSLSLSFGFSPTLEILSIISRIKLFQSLNRLELRLCAMPVQELRQIEESLSQCSLTHLHLNLELKKRLNYFR